MNTDCERAVACIIDDDEDMRVVLARVVRTVGLEAELYESAESFLQRLSAKPIRCLLVDFRLVGMTGVALVEKIAVRQRCDFPVFLISGALDGTSASRARRFGVRIVDMPFNVRDLAQQISAATQGRDH